MSKHRPRDWEGVDWGKTTGQLVSEMGVSKTSVIYWRRKLATVAKRAPARKWAAVDWRRSNIDIAREFGCTNGAVSQQRQKRASITLPRSKVSLQCWVLPETKAAIRARGKIGDVLDAVFSEKP